ncbi:hypothetical protein CL655_01255 [bacterium]|nr:hypothetical protein [bacterium]|tara:strand:+ start:858 stop:1577 length:720 start_codon:yes stop_codon:yes gene_type:complete
MQFFPIKTRRLNPPRDDVLEVLTESLDEVHDGDIVLVTSKVVGIHQGRCVHKDQAERNELVAQEADYVLEGVDTMFPITLKYQNFSVAGGIDASNCGEYYSLLPERPFEAAEEIWRHIRQTTGVTQLGVVITDSYVKPMRAGVVGYAISWWGLHPVESHRGKLDVFGEPLKFSSTNIVDALAAGSAAVCGEAGESTPLVIVRDVPNVTFTRTDTRHEMFKARQDDIYYPLLKHFAEPKN